MPFKDVTEVSGIHFQHHAHPTPHKYLIETMGAGCAFLDYDGDGYQDILLLNGAPLPGSADQQRSTLKLYHNNHNNTFTDVTHQAGLDMQTMYAMGVAVGDYDNDGREDFYVSCALGGGHLFHNEGNGRFKDVTAQAGVANQGKWGTSCAWIDYDRDGKLDLFVCSYVKYNSLQDDTPCFAGANRRIYCIPSAYETSSCTLYHNEGGGRFTDVTEHSGVGKARGKSLGVSIWDYDNDGYPDLFVANDTVPGFLLHNKRDGTFEEMGMLTGLAVDDEGNAHSGMGIDITDVNNDGRSLLAITNYQGQQTSLYQQTADNLFHDIRYNAHISEETGKTLGFGVLFFDYDNDGFKDMIQVNGHVQDDIEQREPGTKYAQPTLLFHNQRDGTFAEVGLAGGLPFATSIVGRGVAVGDIDNDGRLDALITANNGKAMLWHNQTRTPDHWLTLKLQGTRSNRDGIGAMISVTAGGVTQRAMVRSGSSYLSQSDLRAHFGLGAQTTANVEIRWPSGIVDKIAGVACDRIGTAHEGATHLE
jgi:enediyne biosynthesis protein E4